MSSYKILATFTGQTTKLTNDFESSITKHSREVLVLKKASIDYDEVTNQTYHGGDMRVLHHYSLKNYNHLKQKFPEIADRFVLGSFGENIVTDELTEAELNIGDIYSVGSAIVQLTVCRRPCATINYAYRDDRILKEVIRSGRCGWFYRVLQEGEVRAGDHLKFEDRPFPNMPISKLHDQGYGSNPFSDQAFLKSCLNTGLMDKGWSTKIPTMIK